MPGLASDPLWKILSAQVQELGQRLTKSVESEQEAWQRYVQDTRELDKVLASLKTDLTVLQIAVKNIETRLARNGNGNRRRVFWDMTARHWALFVAVLTFIVALVVRAPAVAQALADVAAKLAS